MKTELTPLEQALLSRLTKSEIKDWLRSYSAPYKELMTYYRCAMMEMETKFNVLDEELSLLYDRNPIESIKSRLKTPESIMEKLVRKGVPLTVDSIEKNLRDIAGIRVICSFPSDIYTLADSLICQDDITRWSARTTSPSQSQTATAACILLWGFPFSCIIKKSR